MKEPVSKKFCSCIKKVKKSFKAPRARNERAAIAICVRSVLQSRGKTLRKFKCGKKPRVLTQKIIKA